MQVTEETSKANKADLGGQTGQEARLQSVSSIRVGWSNSGARRSGKARKSFRLGAVERSASTDIRRRIADAVIHGDLQVHWRRCGHGDTSSSVAGCTSGVSDGRSTIRRLLTQPICRREISAGVVAKIALGRKNYIFIQ